MNKLGGRLEELLKGARGDSAKAPAWFSGWQSPWKGKLTGGELVKEGEDELYQLGLRIRERFPNLFDEDYHPDVYNIRSSQVGNSYCLFHSSPRISIFFIGFLHAYYQ